MNKITILCPAKINLSLDVLGKREDGYHYVKMIMQAVKLFDEVRMTPKNGDITISSNLSYVPKNFKNSAYKAAITFFQFTKISSSVHIHLEKKIPVCAGLAGGSTDAAGVLVGLDKLYKTGLTKKQMCILGEKVGADVPFCIVGGSALATGIGEQLTKISPLSHCDIVIVKPKMNISTAAIYSALDRKPITEHPDTNGMLLCLDKKDLKGLCNRLYNVLEPVTVQKCKEISEIKEKMMEQGALGALMSGSGPSVYALFDDNEKAKNCHAFFAKQYTDAFLINPHNSGGIIL